MSSAGIKPLLDEVRYPDCVGLILNIFDRLDNDLIRISCNAESGDYTLNEIAEQIDDLRKKLVENADWGNKIWIELK